MTQQRNYNISDLLQKENTFDENDISKNSLDQKIAYQDNINYKKNWIHIFFVKTKTNWTVV